MTHDQIKASGTPSSSTALFGDGAWREPPGGSGAFGGLVAVSAATYALTAADHAKILVLSYAGLVVLTVPNAGLPANFQIRVVSTTAGFRFASASGVTLYSTTAGMLAVKAAYTPADLYAVGAGTYLIDGSSLTLAYPTSASALTPALAASVSRRVVDGYAGNLLTATRSSDAATQAIGLNGEMLNTAALTSFVGAGAATTAVLYDQSGNGRNLAQTTQARQPLLVTGGTAETNGGRNCLRSTAAAGHWLDASLAVSGATLTVIIVGSLNATSTAYARLASAGVVGQQDYTNNAYAVLLDRDNAASAIRTERNSTFYTSSPVTYGNLFVYAVRWDGATATTFLNGVQAGTSAIASSFGISTVRFMADLTQGSFWDGNLSEVYFYTQAMPTANLVALMSELKAYHNIS